MQFTEWLCAWPSHSYSLWLFVDTRGRQLSLFHHFSLFRVTLHLFLIIFTLFTLVGASASINISPPFGHFEAFCAHLFSVFSVPGLLDFLCPWVCILLKHPIIWFIWHLLKWTKLTSTVFAELVLMHSAMFGESQTQLISTNIYRLSAPWWRADDLGTLMSLSRPQTPLYAKVF